MKIHNLVISFLKNYPSIDIFVLDTLLRIDPTVVQNSRGLFVGRYGVWIGNMCANGNIKLGDIPELKSALITYDKNKSQLPNIKDCKSLSELIEWVKDLSDDFKPVRKQSDAKENLETAYEDDEWIVYVPHSHAAARRGGEGTRWCTASENDYYYNYYSKDGPLYINVRKSDGAKFQFHFESNQFMDSDDEPIRLNKIGLSDGLAEFYTKIGYLFKYRTEFDYVGKVNDGFAAVKLNGRCNFINTEGQILSNQWFEYVRDFKEGFAKVKLNGKYNFINAKRQFLSKQWFDMAWEFNEGFAAVQLNDKWNFINPEGRILSEQWFDNEDLFNDGFAGVKLNGKWNFINIEGQFLSTQWFDDTWNFRDGFAKVKLNGKYNFINAEGRILSEQWFDNAGGFSKGFAEVNLRGKWSLIDAKGQLLPMLWFDYKAETNS